MHTPLVPVAPTPPTTNPSSFDVKFISQAVRQAELGAEEGGIPIGAALIKEDGSVISLGRNRRVQWGSAIRHGETDCLENAGRLPPDVYRQSTMFTTLSPCPMCAGAIILYGIKRVVIGENSTFVGGEDILASRGVEVVNLDLPHCKELMQDFIAKKPLDWDEDIGEIRDQS
ncbi:cytidine deaminase-like protein [Sistotremastrum niveocremeum HHB9708]|uniref:Cytosine deaminase n=2 Tax=Sistotremastraceae TaxID=3402574 RepID=A0A164UNE6_9AGAM|nr:cytidine deaminase-like protein [Sistotremastrum niveocremeum HHB9708]KZT43801.1 cytidine deaminase-like protein [Sistotremastrum suecicum HHB10207 ss-3]